MRRSPLIDYLKAAFLWRWNMLLFGAGAVFAFLSGHPDVVLPLIGAAELAYLGLLTSQPRFRKAVDARSVPQPPSLDDAKLLNQIRTAIKPDAWERFEALRARCLTLSGLAAQFRGPQGRENATITDMQTGSLERLLWMFLKLLYSQDALSRFLRGTDRAGLQREIDKCEKQLKEATAQERDQKLLKSLDDKLQTLRQRLANHVRAAENLEFLVVEIDRIEQKVNAIGEMAINAPTAMDITAQVDGIAAGIAATEEAMQSLDMAPVLQKETAPRLLREQV
ncbi:MAG: hypothetical protein HYZ00_12020 [Candidatus Hydrogenedentes bacterium]|nr:hypothetical protein [Candidatus Hydrogenedentota bacterium]